MLHTAINKADPASPAAHQMMEGLWNEIQTRYGFHAPNPFPSMDFNQKGSCFWIARVGEQPVGSVAIFPLPEDESELDMMYVIPSMRGTGMAHELMKTVLNFAREQNYSCIRLRTGAPQPEAIRFYEKHGFSPIPRFGRWVGDETAICYAKKLTRLE